MTRDSLSTTEFAVLGVLSEHPNHGFAVAKLLEPCGEVGRSYTVRRPLVYRALDRLVDLGLAEPTEIVPGDGGPNRVIHQVTNTGGQFLEEWLAQPVDRVRKLRLEFQLKLAILARTGRPTLPLVRAQRAELADTLSARISATADSNDHLDRWRHHTAIAADTYLTELEHLHTPDPR